MTGLSGGVKEAEVNYTSTDYYSNNVSATVKFTVNRANSTINITQDGRNVIANVTAGAGALAAGSTAFAVGDKAVKAVTKTVDKGAYDIEKEQNQKVYSKITFREKGEKVDKETGLRTKFYKKETK